MCLWKVTREQLHSILILSQVISKSPKWESLFCCKGQCLEDWALCNVPRCNRGLTPHFPFPFKARLHQLLLLCPGIFLFCKCAVIGQIKCAEISGLVSSAVFPRVTLTHGLKLSELSRILQLGTFLYSVCQSLAGGRAVTLRKALRHPEIFSGRQLWRNRSLPHNYTFHNSKWVGQSWRSSATAQRSWSLVFTSWMNIMLVSTVSGSSQAPAAKQWG